MPRFSLLALVLAGTLLAGCEEFVPEKPIAIGNPSEILVVTDSVTWAGPVGDALRATLGQPNRYGPRPEPAFRLRFQPLVARFLDQIQRNHNVMFIATLSDSSDTGRYVRNRVPEEAAAAIEAGGNGVFLRENLWAQDQLVTIATGPTPERIAGDLLLRGDSLRAAYTRLARRVTTIDIYDRGRQTALEDTLMARHGFATNVRVDYLVAQDTAFTAEGGREGQFVRLRRVLPNNWRDFFIYYEEGARPGAVGDPEGVQALLDDLLETFARGSRDSSYVQLERRRPIGVDTVALAGREALELRGGWMMTNDYLGGSFVAYAFNDAAQDRFYLFYGMLHAPDPDDSHRDYLRQLEAAAYTFRTALDTAPTQP